MQGAPGPAGATPPGPSGARLWTFRLVAVVGLPLLLLALLEGGLRLSGVGFPAGFTIPCDVQGRPGACDNPDFGRRFFPPGLARSATPFAVPLEKGPRTFRVAVLGESAAQGDPAPPYGFARFLEAMLREAWPEVHVEVVNAGVVAINSHVMVPIARDVARLRPDVVVVYAGNNEVVGPYGPGTVLTGGAPGLGTIRAAVALSSTRLGQALVAALRPADAAGGEWRGMEMFLERQVRASDPRLEAVYQGFRENLRDAVAAGRGAGAQVVVSTMATRLVGFAPFGWLHRAGLAPADLAAWRARVEAGDRLAAAGRCDAARAEWLAAEAIDAEPAELHHRLGECALAAGDAGEAGARLTRARDLDTLRFRADSRLEAITREVAAASGPGVVLVDGAAAVAAGSPTGLGDGTTLHEHVHLSPRGSWLLARALFPAVAAALPPALRGAGPLPEPAGEAACARRLALTGFDRWKVAREVLARLARPPFTGQRDHEAQVAALVAERDEAGRAPLTAIEDGYRAALATAGDDPWPWLAWGVLLDDLDVKAARSGRPDPGRAVDAYRQALTRLPRLAEARNRLVEALLRLDRVDEAVAEAQALVALRPRQAAPHRLLGQALAAGRRGDGAAAAWRRAAALEPTGAAGRGAALDLGRHLLRLEPPEHTGAVAALAAAAEAGDPAERAEARYLRGTALAALGREAEARASVEGAAAAWREAAQARPDSAEAWLGLGQALTALGDPAGAVAPLARAAELRPESGEPAWRLVKALEASGQVAEAAARAAAAARRLREAGRVKDAESLQREARRLGAGR